MPKKSKSSKRLYKIRRKIPDPKWSLTELVHPHKPTSPKRKNLNDTQLAIRSVAKAAPVEPQPFLKWVGGKGQLLVQLDEFFPADVNRYFEPFIGGGAVFFHLKHRFPRMRAFLRDINAELINTYLAVRDFPHELMQRLDEHAARFRAGHEDYFYLVRAQHHLLRVHVAGKPKSGFWKVPQADSFWRVAEIPLLVAQGINTADKVAVHYNFDTRQSSYYRQAAEFLGLVRQEKDFSYALTDLGREYASLPADERRQLLAGILAHFPPRRAALELSAKMGADGIGKNEIAKLIERHSKISSSTPARRASTILTWLNWLQQATGAVQKTELGFTVR